MILHEKAQRFWSALGAAFCDGLYQSIPAPFPQDPQELPQSTSAEDSLSLS